MTHSPTRRARTRYRNAVLVMAQCLLFVPGFAQLNGSYTISPSSTAYPTISAAVDSLRIRGVNGNVTFNIAPGTYTEQVTIPPIPGASSARRVTFRSATLDSTSVLVQYDATNPARNYVIHVNGASYVTIQHLTVSPLNSNNQTGVLLSNLAGNNTLTNNVFKTDFVGIEGNALVYLDGGGLVSNSVTKNRFEGGGYQLVIAGAFQQPYTAINNNVTENIFEGPARVSIQTIAQRNLTIARNSLRGQRDPEGFGIRVSNCSGVIVIEKNRIDISGAAPIGLQVLNSDGQANQPLTLRNNFVTAAGSSRATALELQDIRYLRVYNNSFHTLGNLNRDDGVAILGYFLETAQLRNNIFSNRDGGRIFTSRGPYNPDEIVSDYNAFFGVGRVTFRSSTTEWSLAQWKMYHGQEVHSVFAAPQFVSDNDLHVLNALALNGAGTPLPQVTDDIDNQPRNGTAPDIGADEFDVALTPFHDLEVTQILSPDTTVCTRANSLQIRVRNNSPVPVSSFHVTWWLFGSLQRSVMFTQTIPAGGSADLNLTPFDFLPNTLYKFKFEASLTGGLADNVTANDSLSTVYSYLDQVRISAKKPDPLCGNETELSIKNFPRESVLWSTGSTQNGITVTGAGTYGVTVTRRGCTVSDTLTIQ